MNKAKAQEHLARADKHIEAGKERIRKQEKRVKTLGAGGHKTETAKETLKHFKNLEETLVKHGGAILEEL